jgi:hypothetical protein
MYADGVAADEEVLDAMRVESFQEGAEFSVNGGIK